MLIEDRELSAAASSCDEVKLRAFASSTAYSPSLTRGCSMGGRREVELLAFTEAVNGARTRPAATNIASILFI
jgi:hypothetical protein